GIRHFIVVMKSPTPSSTSTTKTHEILRGKSSLLAAETSRFNLKSNWISASQHFGSSSRFQRDAGSWSSYGTNFSSPSWSGNTHYIYSVSSSSSFNLYQGRLGGDNFNGDIAEVI